MTVKVSSKYQVVIPEEARKALHLIPGSKVDVIVKGGVAYLVPVKSLGELQKKLAGIYEPSDQHFREKKDRAI